MSEKKIIETLKLKNVYTELSLENGRDLIYKFEGKKLPSDYIVILRGSRKGINKYRIIDLLPMNIRLYFLDYLEHQGPIVTQDSTHWAYNHVFNNEDYKYYISSLYSLNNHAPVGKPFIINN